MKTLFVAPPGTGGIQTWSISVAEYLHAQGFEPHILFETNAESETPALGSSLRKHLLETDFYDGYYYSVKKLADFIEREGFELVYPNTSSMTYRALALMGKKRPVTIACCHLAGEHDFNTISEFATYSDFIIAVSSKATVELNNRLAGSSKIASVLLNSVARHTDPFQGKSEGCLQICFAGRFDGVKRVADTIQVATALRQHGVNYRLKLAGDGPLLSEIEAMILEHRLEQYVQLIGLLDKSEVTELFQSSHINLLLSANEGLPLGVLEGMSCGCVPIVTDVWSCEDAIQHGQEGFVVGLGDYKAVAEHIISLDRDRTLMKQMSHNCIRKINNELSNEVVYPKHLEVIDHAKKNRSKACESAWSFAPKSITDSEWIPNFSVRLVRKYRYWREYKC
jgi:glycosyltransferase involved in cell wall biosynthesis